MEPNRIYKKSFATIFRTSLLWQIKMTQRALHLSFEGDLTLGSSGNPLSIEYDLHSYLGDNVALDIVFSSSVRNPSKLSHILATLTWVDTLRGKSIYNVQGTLANDEEDISSLWNIAGAAQYFKSFEINYSSEIDIIEAVQASDAWNPSNGLGRKKVRLALPVDEPAVQSEDDLYKILTNLKGGRPAGFALAHVKDLSVFSTLLRVIKTMNIPLDIELSPYLNADQALALATSVNSQMSHVQCIWSLGEARPRGATNPRGRTKPFHALGQYIGNKLLRNARTSARGIPKIADPVAGYDYPFKALGLTQRKDIFLDKELLIAFAVAKVNLVREIEFDTATRFVLSDVLTQYDSKTSALRLVNAAEIACFTSNRATDILKRHMLKKMPTYLTDASRDIENFLSACYSDGLIEDSEDLGGVPYRFRLIPDPSLPFERVRLRMERRPVGATRSAIFDEDVLTK